MPRGMTLGNVMFIYGMTLGTYWKYHCQVQISTVDIVPIIVIFSCCRLVFIGICWIPSRSLGMQHIPGHAFRCTFVNDCHRKTFPIFCVPRLFDKKIVVKPDVVESTIIKVVDGYIYVYIYTVYTCYIYNHIHIYM